jgi:putative Mg2+ transporter-C (MgtC) family protein
MNALVLLFDQTFIMFMMKLGLAMLLGLLLGLERIHAHKTAGMRTYAMVSVATAFFISISLFIGETLGVTSNGGFNPAYIAGTIITGIGFLGAGLIIFKDGHIENLTTAAGMWVCAGIGIAVGFGMFREAIFVTLLTFFVLGILSSVERAIRLRVFPDPEFLKTQYGGTLRSLAKDAGETKPKKARVKKVKVTEAA